MSEKQIRSRADFHRVLDETLKKVKELIPKKPGNQPLEEVELQLDAMQRWTADGQTPRKDDQAWVWIGPIAEYQLCPKNDDGDLMKLRPTLNELHWYFVDWPKR
jgi:hypothetical protein